MKIFNFKFPPIANNHIPLTLLPNSTNLPTTNPDPCVICHKTVTDDQRALMCDKCSLWVHTKCQRISNIEYENHEINYELEFECKICRTCALCDKTIAKCHKKLECNLCKKYDHIKCNRLNATDYDKITKSNSAFTCFNCIASQFPFTNMPDNQFDMLVRNGVVCADDLTFSFQPNEFQKRIFDRINEAVNSTSFTDGSDDAEEDFEISPTLSCEYYTIDDFKECKFSPKKNFSILHHNIHSIQCHIEDIRTMLKMLDFQFDILCFSESKIQKGVEPIVPITIPGYQFPPLDVPAESQKGGVLLTCTGKVN